MRYNKQKSRGEESRIDLEIQAGHAYVDLAHALRFARDPSQELEIRKTMDELSEASGYLSVVLASHPDPLLFLASREQVIHENCQLKNQAHHQSESHGHDSTGQDQVPETVTWGHHSKFCYA